MNPETAREVLELIDEAAHNRWDEPIGAQQASETACDLIAECYEDAQGDAFKQAAIRRFDRWAWNHTLKQTAED